MNASNHFPLLGETLALDLVNTRMRRAGTTAGTIVDLLDTPVALESWLGAQRHRIHWRGRARAVDLEAVRGFRAIVDTLLRAALEHAQAPAEVVQRFNVVLAAATSPPTLVWTHAGPRKALPPTDTRIATLLCQVALDALESLTGPQAAQLRRCAHPECILLFVARNPRRRWCRAATCGNRARVARHYHRHQAQA